MLSREASFFFSSRRRHTRCGRDWSSDVCSSDLGYFPFGKETIFTCLSHDVVAHETTHAQIGRASCRERVWISVVAVSLQKKKKGKWRTFTPDGNESANPRTNKIMLR